MEEGVRGYSCEDLQNWVECSMYNSNIMTREECEKAPTKIRPSSQLNELDSNDMTCLIKKEDCSFKFIYNVLTNSIRAQESMECTGNVTTIVAIVISTVLLMWVILLLAFELPRRFSSLPRQGTINSRTS